MLSSVRMWAIRIRACVIKSTLLVSVSESNWSGIVSEYYHLASVDACEFWSALKRLKRHRSQIHKIKTVRVCVCELTGRSWRGGTAHRQASSLGTWANHMQRGQRACNNTHLYTCSSRPGGGRKEETDGQTRQINWGVNGKMNSNILRYSSMQIISDEYITGSHGINWWLWFITTVMFEWCEI